MALYKLNINGTIEDVDVQPGTHLLWVLREHLGLTGTKYGCGIAQCGSCTVHVNGNPMRSCVLPIEGVTSGQNIITIEGLTKEDKHGLQNAWIKAQAPQCGYCQSGQLMQAAALLENNPTPSRDEIIEHMNGNLCRCGTYLRIIKAIQIASGQSDAEKSDE